MNDFVPPVSILLSLGEPDTYEVEEWLHYIIEYGFNTSHIPELARLYEYSYRLTGKAAESPESYAFAHVLRVFGQLQDGAALDYLLKWIVQENIPDVVWEDGVSAIALYGRAALLPLQTALQNNAPKREAVFYVDALLKIAGTIRETQAEVIAILVPQLEQAATNHAEVNADIISCLTIFQAVETLPTIERAYATNNVDTFLSGDLNDVLVELGLKEPDPNRQRSMLADITALSRAASGIGKSSAANKKDKQKRKEAKKQRKKNRKK